MQDHEPGDDFSQDREDAAQAAMTAGMYNPETDILGRRPEKVIEKLSQDQIEEVGNRLAALIAPANDIELFKAVIKIKLEECLSSAAQATFVEKTLKAFEANQ